MLINYIVLDSRFVICGFPWVITRDNEYQFYLEPLILNVCEALQLSFFLILARHILQMYVSIKCECYMGHAIA